MFSNSKTYKNLCSNYFRTLIEQFAEDFETIVEKNISLIFWPNHQ